MNSNYNDYEIFQQRRKRLAAILGEAAKVEEELNMEAASKNLCALARKVSDDTFKVLVMGTFKNGKSTFINSLLGESVLPAYSLPCTAVINEVKYADKKSAVLYFKPTPPEQLSSYIPAKALSHMKAHGMKNVPPMAISYDEIDKYVTIPLGGDQKQAALESPFEKVELFYPLELLKNGVELIDSPGLNEHITRTEVTMGYLQKTDAVLFVLNATALCSQAEMDCIDDELVSNGFENPYFIVNKFDCIQERERPMMKTFAQTKLADYTTNEIFYVSGQDALDAKNAGDTAKLADSGLPRLERCLSDFLTKEKGKAKLVQPAKEIKKVLNDEALRTIIPQQMNMLDTSLDEVKKRYEKAKPKLETLQIQKQQLKKKLELEIDRSKHAIRKVAIDYFLSLGTKIPSWIDDFTPEHKFGLMPTKSRAQTIVNEITDHVLEMITKDQSEWCKSVFQPVVDEKIQSIFKYTADEELKKIKTEINEIKVAVTGCDDVNPSSASPLERFLAAAGGIMVGDIGLAAMGGIGGFSKDLLQVALLEISAGFVLGLIGMLNPFTIALVAIASVAKGILGNGSSAIKKVKKIVADNIVEEVNKKADANTEQMVQAVYDKFMALNNAISQGVDNELGDAKKQVEAIISEMKKGEAGIRKRKEELRQCEQKIHEVNAKLDELMMELANS